MTKTKTREIDTTLKCPNLDCKAEIPIKITGIAGNHIRGIGLECPKCKQYLFEPIWVLEKGKEL